MTARTALLTALALTLVTARPATAGETQTIRWAGNQVARIGDLRTTGGPTLARATRAFGKPTSARLTAPELCVVDWSRIGLRINFVNLGLAPAGQTTCSPRVGKVQSATIRGREFQTQRGLRVGATTADLRRLHSGARFRNGSWWLASRPALIGGEPGEREPIVRANTKGGRVASLVVFVGAAGD